MANLNYFNDIKDPPKTDENYLTRAYLALLRISTRALTQFLNLVNEKLFPNSHLPAIDILEAQPSSIQTQIRSIAQSTGTVFSVLIRNSGPEIKHTVQWSSDPERQYDGLICYDPSLIFIIEVKRRDLGDPRQLDPALSSFSLETQQFDDIPPSPHDTYLNPNPDFIQLYPHPIVLEWRDIITALLNLFLAETLPKRCSSPLPNPELVLFGDFLEFINKYFPELGPYTTLGVCKKQTGLLNKRCNSILKEVSDILNPEFLVPDQPEQYDYLRLAKNSVQRLWLGYDQNSERIWLGVYPGDTVNQARNLFDKTDLSFLQELKTNEWTMYPNLHFSFVSKGLVHCGPEKIDPLKYWDYWSQNQKDIRQWRREEWDVLKNNMKQAKFMNETDSEKFDENFTNTERKTANVCPGLGIEFYWPLDSASDLDQRGRFSQEVKTKAEQVLKVLV